MNMRLLPLLAISASALLALKVLGLVIGSDADVVPVTNAVAQEGAASGDMAGQPAAAPGGDAPAGDAAPMEEGEEAAGAQTDMPPPLPDSLEIGGSAAERAVLESLGKRRESLNQHEQQLDLREKLLQATEERIQKRVDELKQLQQTIEGKVEEKRKQEESEIAGLVTMYESMKPKDAARIFNRLNLTVLLKVVRQMKPRKMADILGKMDSEAAERLTVAIANDADQPDMAPQTGNELPKIQSN